MGSRIGTEKAAAKRLGLSPDEYAARLAAGEKRCLKCERWLPQAAFGVDRSRGDGLATACHDCRYARTMPGPTKRERRDRLAEGFNWCRDCQDWKPAGEVYAGLCRPHINAYTRKRYAENAAVKHRTRQKVYQRKRGVDDVPPHAQEMILEEFGSLCAYCALAPATTWDHIVPVSEGGQTTPGNVVPACQPCNSSKKGRDVWEWMQARGFTPSDAFVNRHILAYAGLYG